MLGKGCYEHLGVIIASNEAAREGEGARFQRKRRPPASAFSHPAGCWQDLGCDAAAWELDPCRAGAGRAAGSSMGQHLLQPAARSFSTCSWILCNLQPASLQSEAGTLATCNQVLLQPAARSLATCSLNLCNLLPAPFPICSLNLCNLGSWDPCNVQLGPLQPAAIPH